MFISALTAKRQLQFSGLSNLNKLFRLDIVSLLTFHILKELTSGDPVIRFFAAILHQKFSNIRLLKMIFENIFRPKISKIYEYIDFSWNFLATLFWEITRFQHKQQNKFTYNLLIYYYFIQILSKNFSLTNIN